MGDGIRSYYGSSLSEKQRGVALIISLIILLMLTMLVTTSLRNASIDERIAGNARDHSLAFQSTEGTLRTANTDLIGKSIWDFTDSCTGGLCTLGNAPMAFDYDWAAGTKHVAIDKSSTSALISSNLAENPKYFVEYAGMIKSTKCNGGWCPVYRVTGRANGNNSTTTVVLQEVERQH